MTNTNIPVKKELFYRNKKATSCVTSVYTSQITLTDHLLQALQTPWTQAVSTQNDTVQQTDSKHDSKQPETNTQMFFSGDKWSDRWSGRCSAWVKCQPPRALICPTFSDADQLMYSTVTLATWKDNAVSMSHAAMEGTRDKNITVAHLNMFRRSRTHFHRRTGITRIEDTDRDWMVMAGCGRLTQKHPSCIY